jgi:hypothetical protein
MSDPLNLSVTDHLRSLTQGVRIDAQLAGASAIRHAISRWYRGEELFADEGSAMKIVNNSGNSVVTLDPRRKPQNAPPPAPPARTNGRAAPAAEAAAPPHLTAVEVLRSVEETQRRSVAALKAMVELLIEKGVFSRDEYLSRVKR